jgi:D-arabinan exo alpha-(1,3)/(1,5)-arabinofuranosidase (non-reducing end)
MRNFPGALASTFSLISLAFGCAARDRTEMTAGGPGPLGLQEGLGTLPLLGAARTRSISAENPTGEPGGGGRAIPARGEPKPAASARAADDLGQGWKVRPFLRVNAGQTVQLMDVAGPGVIQHIWMVEGLSRSHVLRFFWDDEKTPSIEVPVPDFFAVGHERFAPVNSLAVIVNPQNALNCYWPMPFRKHARVEFENQSDRDLELLAFQITYLETEIPPEAGYFHAQWRRAGTGTVNPYVIVDGIEGRGAYAGTFLAWTQLSKGWFGEGEIKFFMDGDRQFPTICGTGTEDYFCGSYGFPASYTTAYAGTTLPSGDYDDLPNSWSLYRWHIRDPIHFQKELRVTIQALGWGPDGKYLKLADDIASVAYWYQTEPHAPFPPLPGPVERSARRVNSPSPHVEGALEGEDLRVIGRSGGKTERQDLASYGHDVWNGDAHLWWTGAKPGDTLDLAVPVKEAGSYRLTAQLTRAVDYGIVQLSLDGKALGGPIDLYRKEPGPSGPLDLGVHQLGAGDHTLRVTITGAGERAKKAYMFGLDYLLLAPVK